VLALLPEPRQELVKAFRIVGPSASRASDSLTGRQLLILLGERLNNDTYWLPLRQTNVFFKLDGLTTNYTIENRRACRQITPPFSCRNWVLPLTS
jgi:hypothetical protein